jgi:hypothetical protein
MSSPTTDRLLLKKEKFFTPALSNWQWTVNRQPTIDDHKLVIRVHFAELCIGWGESGHDGQIAHGGTAAGRKRRAQT